MNIRIWREKLREKVYSDGDASRRTGTLRDSVETLEGLSSGDAKAMSYRFASYGLYVDRGVGREKGRGNSGDIGLVRSDGRERQIRIPKPWFSYKWRRSVDRLVSRSAEITGRNALRRVIRLVDRSV